jgi:hypothetical protein
MKTKVQIVEEMLDILDSPEHWCKHQLERQDNFSAPKQRCILGALNMAHSGTSSFHFFDGDDASANALAVRHTMDKLAVEDGYVSAFTAPAMLGSGAHAVAFNNAPETEFEDIRLFLKKTLVELELEDAR